MAAQELREEGESVSQTDGRTGKGRIGWTDSRGERQQKQREVDRRKGGWRRSSSVGTSVSRMSVVRTRTETSISTGRMCE